MGSDDLRGLQLLRLLPLRKQCEDRDQLRTLRRQLVLHDKRRFSPARFSRQQTGVNERGELTRKLSFRDACNALANRAEAKLCAVQMQSFEYRRTPESSHRCKRFHCILGALLQPAWQRVRLAACSMRCRRCHSL
jgi:hypothetical protein